jgi:protein-tyrosine phosphatase
MDTQDVSRHLPINGAYNIRDLGGYAAASGRTRWRAVLRADALHRVDAAGVAALVAEGVRTVIDLRLAAELEAAPNPFRTHETVRYMNIPLFEKTTAPEVKGPDEDVLLELYNLALAQRQDAIRTVLEAIAAAEDGVVMFHCTAGKDRTGIIAALLLGIGGVDSETISEDYSLTYERIAPMLAELLNDARARGADVTKVEPMLQSRIETMRNFLAHIEDVYGGIDAYLEAIGITTEIKTRLRARLVEEIAEGVN